MFANVLLRVLGKHTSEHLIDSGAKMRDELSKVLEKSLSYQTQNRKNRNYFQHFVAFQVQNRKNRHCLQHVVAFRTQNRKNRNYLQHSVKK